MEFKDIWKFEWLTNDKLCFPRSYPEHIKTKQQKILFWLFKQWHTYGTGKGAVLGKFTQPFQEIFFVIAGVEFYGLYHFNKFTLGIFLALCVIISWIFGRLYMALEIDKIESLPPMQRSIFSDEVYERTKKKKTNEAKKNG